jgi:hypothetical protein
MVAAPAVDHAAIVKPRARFRVQAYVVVPNASVARSYVKGVDY